MEQDYMQRDVLKDMCSEITKWQEKRLRDHFIGKLPCKFCIMKSERVENLSSDLSGITVRLRVEIMCDHEKPCVMCNDYKPIKTRIEE